MISIGDVLSLVEMGVKLRELPRRIQERQADGLVSPGHLARKQQTLYEFLFELYYDLGILSGPDGPFPIGVLPLSSAAINDPENLSVKVRKRKEPYKVLHLELVDALKRRGSKIWNGPTFSLITTDLNETGSVSGLKACIGSYFNMVASADYLEYELLARIMQSDSPIALEDLPARSVAISDTTPSNCLLSGGGVDAAIAISTLVVYAREGQYWLLCDVRSKSVAEYGDLYHVIPSFIYQPVTAITDHNLRIERSVRHNIYREYLEELFDVPEVGHAGRPIAPDYFYDFPNLALLRDFLAEGAAEIRGTAFIFNLLTHRPEICTLLLIRDESWYQQQKDISRAKTIGLRHLNLNNEFLLSEDQINESHLEIVTTLPLDDPRWKKIVKPWQMVPPGAPALIFGVKGAVKLLSIEEPDWVHDFHVEPPRHFSP
jgi:hypothetical protein